MAELAPSEVVELLDADATTAKRASWEAFEFTLLGDGDVEVVNNSHECPDEHTYTVHVEGGALQPTLTIAALSLRLAVHLRERLR